MGKTISNRKRKFVTCNMQWYKCVYCGMPEYMHFHTDKGEKCYVKVEWKLEPFNEKLH